MRKPIDPVDMAVVDHELTNTIIATIERTRAQHPDWKTVADMVIAENTSLMVSLAEIVESLHPEPISPLSEIDVLYPLVKKQVYSAVKAQMEGE